MRVEKVIFFCHIYQNPVWSAAIYKRNFWYYIGVSSHMDDEYKWAGVEDPKVMVTTSRDPSSRLKMFAKVC